MGFDDEGLGTILLEGALTAEALTYPFVDDGALIHPTSKVKEDAPSLTEVAGQLLEASLSEVSARADTQEMHTLCRSTPHTPEGFDGKLCDEVQRLRRMDRTEPVGLARVGSNLREELIVRHTRRCRQPQLLTDATTDLTGYLYGHRLPDLILRHIEEGLIKRNRLDDIGVVVEDAVNGSRDFAVAIEVHRHEDELRAELTCLRPRHSRAYPEAPSFVARSTDHPTRLRSAHGNRQPPKLGMVVLLYRGVEGIHIDVYDLAHGEGEGWTGGLGRSYHFLGR